jgi:uncharacterized membrane protein
MTPAASLFDWILAVHIMAVVVAFGVTFAYPIMFAVAARSDPRSLPLMHRIEYTVERLLLNPGLRARGTTGASSSCSGAWRRRS